MATRYKGTRAESRESRDCSRGKEEEFFWRHAKSLLCKKRGLRFRDVKTEECEVGQVRLQEERGGKVGGSTKADFDSIGAEDAHAKS